MNEDLKNKTDEELRDIMRASIDNQHVPSSIYHKAKQELEFRKQDSLNIRGIHNSNISINSANVKQTNLMTPTGQGEAESDAN
ncbi:hypothetical protein A3D14_00805 [Candidatus Saccharibacteria bacterium RIFCSPHIGHO2_02_FULL_47_12]|nr:MAG: hypothetical protein A3D14_00805 [Candidatus Saccharibacteria bacterium RIFCSPHIGHO2_02_FULL_47_12]